MIYSEMLNSYENHKTLSGKAWEHAVAIDLLTELTQDVIFLSFPQQRESMK